MISRMRPCCESDVPMNHRDRKFMLYLFLAALLVRLLYLRDMAQSPYFGAPFLDELYHVNRARDIAAGRLLGPDVFFRAPLYVYLLGLVIRIFGLRFFVIGLLQHVYGAASVLAVYALAGRIFSRREARLAGILAMCYAPFIYFEGEMLDIFLQFLLYPVILILAMNLGDKPGWKKSLGLGALMGVSALARPNILLFLPFLLAWLLWNWRGAIPVKRRLILAATGAAGLVLTILPATIHNAAAGRCFVPIASFGGINFYIGNNPNADGYTARTARRMHVFGGYRDSVEMFSAHDAALALDRRNLTAAETSRYWTRSAFGWILSDPVDWARLTLKKTVLFLGNYEIKNNKNIYFVARYSGILRYLLAFLPFGLVAAAGLTGMALALSGKDARRAFLPALFAAVYALGVILFFVSDRHRVPVVVVLLPFAAHALIRLWDAAERGDRTLMGAGCGAIIVLALLSFTDWFGVRPENTSRDLWSVGNCLREKGRYDESLDHYRKALAMDPDYVEARNNIGEIYYQTGQYSEALRVFGDLVRRHPDYPAGWNNLGVCYEQTGLWKPAEDSYRNAAGLDPGYLRARFNLAECLMKQGRRRDAAEELKNVLRNADSGMRMQIMSDERFRDLLLSRDALPEPREADE